MSDLVGNPETRFSHNEAHIMSTLNCVGHFGSLGTLATLSVRDFFFLLIFLFLDFCSFFSRYFAFDLFEKAIGMH